MANYFEDNRSLAFHLTHPLMERIVELKEQGYTVDPESPYRAQDYADALSNYREVLSIVGEISGEIIAANAEAVDAEGPRVVDGHVEYHPGTQANHDALAQAGLYGMSLPRQYGGLNFPIVPYVMAAELVSRGDGGFANIWGLQDCAETIHEFASEEQKAEYLPLANEGQTFAMALTEPDAGSDLQAVMLRAHYDEAQGTWLLNGVKRFITNGDADVALVMARSEPGTRDGRGISLFLYRKSWGGVRVRRIEHKMGIIGSPTCELVFTNARAELVGERRLGLIKYVMSLMNGARLGVGAQSVGVAEAAFREALKYANEREQFGKRIVDFPAVYEMLAQMRTKLDGMRSLLYETSRYVDVYKALTHISKERKLSAEERTELKDYQRWADLFTPLTKLVTSEFCNQIAYDAIQIHGGTGFMKDFPVERHYRDARILPIYEGTSQLQVVAAIRGVTTDILSKRLSTFSEAIAGTKHVELRDRLERMRAEWVEDVAYVMERQEDDFLTFHSGRLVEMGAMLAMCYCLFMDTERDEYYLSSLRVLIPYAEGIQAERHQMLRSLKAEDVAAHQALAAQVRE